MASRRKGRILAFQALYAWDVAGTPLDELLDFAWLDEDKRAALDDEVRVFAGLMIAGTIGDINRIDESIRRRLEHWTFERLKRVELAILRISVWSLLEQADIPAQITIDEAIEIAKEFGSEDSYKFINGVLDGVWKAERKAD